MTKTKKSLIGLAGAAAVASAAYGAGTQVGGGEAQASRQAATTPGAVIGHGGPGAGAGLQSFADRLGVSADRLSSALSALRWGKDRPDGAALAQALADATGKPLADVQAALDAQRPDRGGRGAWRDAFAAALAKQLGLDTAKVTSALDGLRSTGGPRGATDRAAKLASALDVDESKLKSALEAIRPTGPRGPFGADAATLAKALGVDEAKVQAGLDAFAKTERARHDTQRAAFAKALADKLGISVDKVTAALADGAPFGGPGGFGHRGGPGLRPGFRHRP